MWNLATDFGAVGSVLPCCQSMLSRSSSVISHILLAEALLLLDFSSSDLFIFLLLTSSTAMTSTSSSTSSFTETETFQVRLGSCLHAWLEDALPTRVGYLRAGLEVFFPDLRRVKLEVEPAVLHQSMKRVSRLCCSGVHEVKREDWIVPRESCSSELLHLTDELQLGLVKKVLRKPAGDVVKAYVKSRSWKKSRE